jgi:hypothetical protein
MPWRYKASLFLYVDAAGGASAVVVNSSTSL